jgi:hypothetical protein
MAASQFRGPLSEVKQNPTTLIQDWLEKIPHTTDARRFYVSPLHPMGKAARGAGIVGIIDDYRSLKKHNSGMLVPPSRTDASSNNGQIKAYHLDRFVCCSSKREMRAQCKCMEWVVCVGCVGGAANGGRSQVVQW